MTTGDELLAEIWKRPNDRALLSVYADWLDSQGESTRAEYMQLSLLERPSKKQAARRVALKNRYRGAWLGPARPFVWTWEESEEVPGFIARVQCSMPKLTKGFELVEKLGPRLHVTVSEPKAKREFIALATVPLGRVYGLCFCESDARWITDELLTTLAPTFKGLRSLALYTDDASDRGFRAVLEHLDALERLALTISDNVELWLDALLESRVTHTLKALSLPDWIDDAHKRRLKGALPTCVVESDEVESARLEP